MNGFGESQRENLKNRRVQDWRQIYLILFPNDDERSIPSECGWSISLVETIILTYSDYSNMVAISNILDQFQRHYQQEAERLLPERLNPILDGYLTGPRTTFQDSILAMINEIHNTLIQSFRQRIIGVIVEDTEPVLPGNSSVVTPSRFEPSLNNPASFFLEYLNTINDDVNQSHQLSTHLGFDLSGFPSPALHGQSSGHDYDIHSSQPQPLPAISDGDVNTFTLVDNPNVSNARGVEEELKPSENYKGSGNNEWTLLDETEEASS